MISNSDRKHIIKLHQKKYRERYEEFLVEGKKGVEEAITSNREVIMLVLQENEEKNFENLLKLAKNKGVRVEKCSKSQSSKIKTTKTFPGVMAVVKAEKRSVADFSDNEPIICLDHISDPGNLGTIIRTADWFGVNNILISEGSVEARNEKVVRSSMGSIFHTKIAESNDIISDLKGLKNSGYKLIGLDTDGENIKRQSLSRQAVYIFGSESHGLSTEVEKILDTSYTIEGTGQAESLNIGVSAGIFLFQIS
jgi:TrmH family RNA methyltransferase